MRDFLTFGLVACFLLAGFGCAHTSDSATAGMPRQQEVAQAQPSAAPAQVVASAPANAAPAPVVAVAPGTPRVDLPETVFDFGVVADGTDYIHSFKVRNVGSGELVLKKVMPG
jgi:hypothetical protein